MHKYQFTQDSRNKSENDGGLGSRLGVCCWFFKSPSDWNVIGLLSCAHNDERQGEVGRSMIEMLGVLAIIAVLSVGGIAGYSKALSMYKWTKALDQWRSMISTINVYMSQLQSVKVVDVEVNLVPILLALDSFPDDMKMAENKYRVKDALGNILNIYNYPGYTGIMLSQTENSYMGCKIFLTIGNYYHNMIEVIQLHTFTNYNQNTLFSFMGDNMCRTGASNCLKDLTVSQINEICKKNDECSQAGNCNYLMYWHRYQ